MTVTQGVYLTGCEPATGKSAVALGLHQLLSRRIERLGVFRPVAPPGDDPLLGALQSVAPEEAPVAVGVGYDDVRADERRALEEIVTRFHALATQCDGVLVIGTDFAGVGTASELAFNGRVALNLGLPVVAVVSGHARTAGDVGSAVSVALTTLRRVGCGIAAVVANRVAPGELDAVAAQAGAIAPGELDAVAAQAGAVAPGELEAVAAQAGAGAPAELGARAAQAPSVDLPLYVMPEDDLLMAPTVGEIAAACHGEPLSATPEALAREACGVLVAAMTLPNLLERITDSALLIAPGDRADVLLTAYFAQVSRRIPSVAGIVLTGGLRPPPALLEPIDGLPPIVLTEHDTYETATLAGAVEGKISAAAPRKITSARALFEQYVDGAALLDRLEVSRPVAVTPLMFQHDLLDRARADPKRIVLPEGGEERILRAAEILLRRRVAELTLLGDEEQIRATAGRLGVDVTQATVLDPAEPELRERFAQEYATRRAHKGVTVDAARDVVTSVSYFGTLMVALGMADGMVSGATHTTAETIRPSFELVKTREGVSIVSSVFLMCLRDRVLVYGDCAVNPQPTAEQLADIAISSAETARAFAIEPRVAMLSYSTGESGSGAEVERVRAATELVRERAPELSVEGPIQYDAAVDASVARTKLPGSAVAGRATVFIFPDLNTGNNTYKAVQRSANAVAIGPVLQGLRKPVNDLSRGATVEDIVNTVAITAIQAQRL